SRACSTARATAGASRRPALTGFGAPAAAQTFYSGDGRLVIVESPKKAWTIQGILGRSYRVEASFGHVFDLPPKRLGVAVDDGFAPEWVPVAKARPRLT